MITLEKQIFDYYNNLKNYLKNQPLLLGSNYSGGGGPPGGIIGYLPQSRVSYDPIEDDSCTYSGVPTLVDNLNKIRCRISNLEASGGGGGTGRIDIYQSGILIASGIEQLDFYGDVDITVSGTEVTVIHPTEITEEYFTSSGTVRFNLSRYPVISGTLNLSYNGLLQSTGDYTIYSTYVETDFTVPSGNFISINYKYRSDLYTPPTPPSGASGYGEIAWGTGAWGS